MPVQYHIVNKLEHHGYLTCGLSATIDTNCTTHGRGKEQHLDFRTGNTPPHTVSYPITRLQARENEGRPYGPPVAHRDYPRPP